MEHIYTADEIKEIIIGNQHDIAFVLGNGLNRQACNQAISWFNLLKKIGGKSFEDYIEKGEEEKKTIDGISYTEIFDALENHSFKERMESANWYDDVIEYISRETPFIRPFRSGLFDDDIDQSQSPLVRIKGKIKQLLDEHKSQKPCVFAENERKDIRDICYSLGIDESAFMRQREDNDKELYNRLKQLYQKLSSNYFSVVLANELKEKVCNEIEGWTLNDEMSPMLQSIHEMNAPILTTNFDLSISKKMDELYPNQMEYQVMKSGKKSEVFPWSYYYGHRNLPIPSLGFGIWHMHGVASKPQSLCLGLSDYMRCAKEAWKMIHYDSFFESDGFMGKNTIGWKGYKTWLHIIFNKSLFITGLTLDENETFLRWLLIQRAKYFALFGSRSHKGWYVYPEEEEKEKKDFFGKKAFLEKAGIELLPTESYEAIYKHLWI